MQLPSLEAGERSASFSYSVDESKFNLSSNVVESYVINAQDGNGSSDSGDFNLSIVAAGVDNKLTVDSYQSGNIDDVNFYNLSAINLQGGNDTAVVTANGQIDTIDGGDVAIHSISLPLWQILILMLLGMVPLRGMLHSIISVQLMHLTGAP